MQLVSADLTEVSTEQPKDGETRQPVAVPLWAKPEFQSFPLNDALGHNPFRARDFIPHFGVS